MTRAYYNDSEPYVCAWLRNLIAAGHIAPGDVDERSIADVRPADVRGYAQCHWFAGLGGWSYALRLAGWPDNRPLWTGSCPCQPFSAAGSQLGTTDPRHLWPELYRLIAECAPPIVVGEQVASKAGRAWLHDVFIDLETCGYAVAASDLPACSVGAEHRRQRLWFVADSDPQWHEQSRQEPRGGPLGRMGREQQLLPWHGGWRAALARLRTVDDGIPRCVEATDAARNAIVPQVAAEFIAAVMECRP